MSRRQTATAPGRVQIYTVVDGQEDTLLGTTNAAGVLVTNRFCQTAGEKFTVYAKGEARPFLPLQAA